MNLPREIAAIDTKVSDANVPIRTIIVLYSDANNAAAICVLSPHSVIKIRVKPERNALLKCRLSSNFPLLPFHIRMPKIMNTIPENILKKDIGIIYVIKDPARIAAPSTIIKARTIPINSFR
jgi:hypothetical protein